MKKFILCVLLSLSLTPVHARPNKPIMLTNKNMEAVLSEIFESHQQSVIPGKKQWQAAFFLTSNNGTWDSINKLTRELNNAISNGTLARAVVLYDRRAKQSTDTHSFRPGEDGTYLFLLKPNSSTRKYTESAPEHNYYPITVAPGTNISDLLNKMLRNMNNTNETYNYVHIHAHGSGKEMTHYVEGALTFETIFQAVQKQNLHVHVLNTRSCWMGTLANAQTVFQNKRVDYWIASSNMAASRYELSNATILKYLDKTPREAVKNAVNEKFSGKYCPNGNCDSSFTHNLFVLERSALKQFQSLNAWFEAYKQYPLKPSVIPELHNQEAQNKHLISVKQLLIRWIKTVKKAPQKNSLTAMMQERTQREKAFRAGARLYKDLRKATLSYKCWDAEAKTIYSNPEDIPATSDCIDGVTIFREELPVKNSPTK